MIRWRNPRYNTVVPVNILGVTNQGSDSLVIIKTVEGLTRGTQHPVPINQLKESDGGIAEAELVIGILRKLQDPNLDPIKVLGLELHLAIHSTDGYADTQLCDQSKFNTLYACQNGCKWLKVCQLIYNIENPEIEHGGPPPEPTEEP